MIIDAVLSPAEIALLPATDLGGTTCVVFDVLRATSSMVTALAHGAAAIWPVSTIAEALALQQELPAALLGGERHGERIEGFDLGNSPFEYRELAGRTVISTTTNGTVALRACAAADRVLIGAVLNLDALAACLVKFAPTRLLLVCAGTFNSPALEDAWAAGRLIEMLAGVTTERTDAAEMVRTVAAAYPHPADALRAARNGQVLARNGRAAEVDWCAQLSLYGAVGLLQAGSLRRLDPVASEVAPGEKAT